jgi:hypothetical protein
MKCIFMLIPAKFAVSSNQNDAIFLVDPDME